MESRETGQQAAEQASAKQIGAPVRPSEWVAAVAWLITGIVVLIATSRLKVMSEFGPGPGFLSVCLGIILLALASLQLLKLVRIRFLRTAARGAAVADSGGAPSRNWARELPGRVRHLATNKPLLRFILLAGSLVLYGLVLDAVGFLIATIFLCWSALALLGRAPLRAAVEGVVAVVVLYWAFTVLLRVQLPGADLQFLKALGL